MDVVRRSFMNLSKSTLSVAVTAIIGISAISTSAEAITLTFGDNTNPATMALNPDAIGSSNTTALPAGFEFRMIDPAGAGGGGPPQAAKDVIFGGETWSFNGAGNTMSGVSGTPSNPGAGSFAGSAAPTANTNPTVGQPAPFFFQGFNFLAPTTGSLAGAAYGAASISASFTSSSATTGTMTIQFPTLEAQWAGVWFPLGQNFTGTDTAGVTLSGAVSCAVGGLNCSFRLQGQETINNAAVGTGITEDPSAAGFGNWTAQWDLVGTVNDLSSFHSAVPVPAAVWLFGSGLIGLVGVARPGRIYVLPGFLLFDVLG
mgnify:CR=1 FL=1